MKSWKKFLIVSLSLLFVVTSVFAGLVNFVKVDDTSNKGQNKESGVVTPGKPNDYDGMVYYASESEETGAVLAPREMKGGAIYIGAGSSFVMSSGIIQNHEGVYGGAIYVADGGTFTMTGGSIEYNYSMYGGAIYIENGGTCNINGGSIKLNKSQNAPAIYVEDGGNLNFQNNGSVNIDNNEYTKYGAVELKFYVDGVLTLTKIQNVAVLNMNNVPLDLDNCCGYFIDEEFTQGVKRGDDLSIYQDDELIINDNIFNIYTKTATLDKLKFTMNSDNCSYSVSSNNSCSGNVVIPATYQNLTVNEIHIDGFSYCRDLESVTLNNEITKINDRAFAYAEVLETINLPNNVVEISQLSFQFCVKLNNIKLPKYLTTLSYGVLSGCKSLSQIDLSNENLTTISNSALYGCVGLKSLLIDLNLKSIDLYAFYDLKMLEELYINNNFTNINTSYLFQNLSIDSENGCNVRFGEDVTEIPSYLFQKTNLNIVEFGENITLIERFAFFNSQIGEIIFNDKLATIGENAFQKCTKLQTLNIPDSVVSLSEGSFSECTSLVNCVLSNSLGEIPARCFYNCDSLIEVDYGNAYNFAEYCFYGCEQLQKIDIISDGSDLGDYAFAECTGVNEVNCNLTNTPSGTEPFKNLASKSENGCVLNAYTNSVPSSLFMSTGISNINFLSQIISIGRYAFYNTKIQTLVIPDTVKIVDVGAFCNISTLESVVIGSGVEKLGNDCFKLCVNLSLVTFNVNSVLKEICAYSFQDCKSLRSITLPSKLEIIRGYSFQGTSISSMTIPSKVYMVGKCAFANDNLVSVAFEDTNGWYFSNASYGSETTPEQGTSADVTSASTNAQLMKDMASGDIEQKHLLKQSVV